MSLKGGMWGGEGIAPVLDLVLLSSIHGRNVVVPDQSFIDGVTWLNLEREKQGQRWPSLAIQVPDFNPASSLRQIPLLGLTGASWFSPSPSPF